MNPSLLNSGRHRWWYALVLVVWAVIPLGQDPNQSPPRDAAQYEAGVRLRVYHIGRAMESLRPLREGQSPNVDQTVATLDLANDDAPFSGTDDEAFDRQYVAEMTGSLFVDVAGEYEWRVGSTAAVQVFIDGVLLIDPTGPPTWSRVPVHLDQGWHGLRIMQWVNEPNERFMSHDWKPPGSEEFQTIRTSELRAPAFYFRPTQPGTKALQMAGDRPGLGMKLDRVHPSYRVVNLCPDMEMPVGGLGMLSDGRLIVARFDARTLKAPYPTEEPNGQLWLMSGVESDDPEDVSMQLIAEDLFEPSGVCVIDDVIYVSQRRDVSRFEFNARSGQWDKTVVASGWETNDFHQICAGLLYEPGGDGHPGFLYVARSPGLGLMQNPPDHGSVWRIDLSMPAGENVTPLTGGHRTPNGIGYGPDRQIFVIDNQGEWTPANELNHVIEGRFYGFFHRHNPPRAYRTPFQPDDPDNADVQEAAVLLPQDEIGNSPTQPLMFPPGHEFEGQLALADMRYGGVNRVFLEEVNGVWQGCAMRFTQGLRAGPNRILFGPDGSLYAGGIGGSHASTWYWVDPAGNPTFEGLERLVPTGATAFEVDHVSATSDGLDVYFTRSVPRTFLEAASNFAVASWRYSATRRYGGPKIDMATHVIKSTHPSPDRKSVRLVIPGLKEGHVIHLRTDPVSDGGESIWSGDVWYTLNRIPMDD